jgi:hypothetical protein
MVSLFIENMEESASLQAAKNDDTYCKLFRKKWEMMKEFGNDAMEKSNERRILLEFG